MKLVRVSGGSMEPTLSDGDIIIVTKARTLRPGFLYVVIHPAFGRMVKRLGEAGQLISDHADGTHPDRLGTIEACQLVGEARFVISPSGIRRLRAARPYSPRA